MKPADAFERLAEQVSMEAARIDCTPSEYRDGLTTIIEQLHTDRQASRETNPNDDD